MKDKLANNYESIIIDGDAALYLEYSGEEAKDMEATDLGRKTLEYVNGLNRIKGGYIAYLADRIVNDRDKFRAEVALFCKAATEFHGAASNPVIMRLRNNLQSDTMQRLTGNKWTITQEGKNKVWTFGTAKPQENAKKRTFNIKGAEQTIVDGMKGRPKVDKINEVLHLIKSLGLTVADLETAKPEKKARKAS